jgi:hypothetical protein
MTRYSKPVVLPHFGAQPRFKTRYVGSSITLKAPAQLSLLVNSFWGERLNKDGKTKLLGEAGGFPEPRHQFLLEVQHQSVSMRRSGKY